MTLKEFAVLKAGDTVENVFTGSKGCVSEIKDSGVGVQWGATPGGPAFFYPVNSTAWMHWSKVDAA